MVENATKAELTQPYV